MTCRHPNRPAPRRGRDAVGDLWCLQIMAPPRLRRMDIAARGGAVRPLPVESPNLVRPQRISGCPVGPARGNRLAVDAKAEGLARGIGLAGQITAAQPDPASGRGGARRDRRIMRHLRAQSGRPPQSGDRYAEHQPGNAASTFRFYVINTEYYADFFITSINIRPHRHCAIRIGPGHPHIIIPGPLRRQRDATAGAKGCPRQIPVPAEIALHLVQHVAVGMGAAPVMTGQAERQCRLQRICRPQVGPEQDADLVPARAQPRRTRPVPAKDIGRRQHRAAVQRHPGHFIRPVHRKIGGGAVGVKPPHRNPVARRNPAQAVFVAPPAGVRDHPGPAPGTDRVPRQRQEDAVRPAFFRKRPKAGRIGHRQIRCSVASSKNDAVHMSTGR